MNRSYIALRGVVIGIEITFHLFSHSHVIRSLLLLSCKNHESCLRGYQAPSSVIPVTYVFASSLPK
jgi:hypothetical protein